MTTDENGDEIVYVSKRNNGGSNRDRVYHTNTDCRHYSRATCFEWTREKAEEWGIRECTDTDCGGQYEREGGDQSMHYALKRKGEKEYPDGPERYDPVRGETQ